MYYYNLYNLKYELS